MLDYASRALVSLVVSSCFAVIHMLVVLLQYQARFSERMSSLTGAAGTTWRKCLTAIVNSSMAPYQCVSHCSGLEAVYRFPAVICGDGDETVMRVVAGIFLALPFVYATTIGHIYMLFFIVVTQALAPSALSCYCETAHCH